MMRISIFIFLLMLMAETAGIAQRDKLYLSNGSKIYGQVKSLESKSTLFQTDKSLITVNNSEIWYIRLHRKNRLTVDRNIADSVNSGFTKPKMVHAVQGGVLIGGETKNSTKGGISISAIGYYRLSQLIQLGIGVGIENYRRFSSIPVFFYYKGDFSKNPTGLFYYTGLGYGKVWERKNRELEHRETSGGTVFKIGLGHNFRINRCFLYVSAGYSVQQLKESYDLYSYGWDIWNGGGSRAVVSRSMNRLEFKIGLNI